MYQVIYMTNLTSILPTPKPLALPLSLQGDFGLFREFLLHTQTPGAPYMGTGNVHTDLYAKPVWMDSYPLSPEVSILVEQALAREF